MDNKFADWIVSGMNGDMSLAQQIRAVSWSEEEQALMFRISPDNSETVDTLQEMIITALLRMHEDEGKPWDFKVYGMRVSVDGVPQLLVKVYKGQEIKDPGDGDGVFITSWMDS